MDKQHSSIPGEILASMRFMRNNPDFPRVAKLRTAYANVLAEFLKNMKMKWTEENLEYAWKSIRRPN